MAYRNKTYICFDGDTDMHYYRLMTAWAANDRFEFSFHNAHDLNTARDTSQEESIKRKLRERFANSKLMIVLIGEKTRYLTKFVRWEMEVALRLNLPIIGVNLNGARDRDNLSPPAIREELVLYVPFGPKAVHHAMEIWPGEFGQLQRQGKSGPYALSSSTYKSLGM
ncbi:MAG: TIR domain-containing protein [Phenylobacterium sp.]|uniref:TIR domain-containing protein n=1 Tax=Phenylobacterium sp. TaxID=1871053 RepID=UPI001A4BD842|nr:TIR domain-containing protein [Phenylobacterium sp.]MBL8554594.1 TIR domain-containing protein [Phenylobacterium sp.]